MSLLRHSQGTTVRIFLFAALLLSAASCSPPSADHAKGAGTPPSEASQQAAPSATPSQRPVSFIVRFKSPHPLAPAQELEAAGRCEEAQRLARETLAARPELAGLCFDRFTVGGAEIVLAACAPVAEADAQRVESDWVQRLTAMEGVEYAEPNVVLTAAGCP